MLSSGGGERKGCAPHRARPRCRSDQFKLPQKCWILRQASSSNAFEVAYDTRKFGPLPKAEPCTTATPSVSSSALQKSSSVSMTEPSGALRPITSAHEG